MELVRTTLRINKPLKKKAEELALENNTTLQQIVNNALLYYLVERARVKQKPIKIKSFNLGAGLDNLTRDDIYGEPDFSRF
jgi:hypothetical protein